MYLVCLHQGPSLSYPHSIFRNYISFNPPMLINKMNALSIIHLSEAIYTFKIYLNICIHGHYTAYPFEIHSLAEHIYSNTIRFLTISLIISNRLPKSCQVHIDVSYTLLHSTDEPREKLFKLFVGFDFLRLNLLQNVTMLRFPINSDSCWVGGINSSLVFPLFSLTFTPLVSISE